MPISVHFKVHGTCGPWQHGVCGAWGPCSNQAQCRICEGPTQCLNIGTRYMVCDSTQQRLLQAENDWLVGNLRNLHKLALKH